MKETADAGMQILLNSAITYNFSQKLVYFILNLQVITKQLSAGQKVRAYLWHKCPETVERMGST